MPQQINLRAPILLTQRHYFSAQTMAVALGVFVMLGGALCAYWVWSLTSSTQGLRLTLNGYAKEKDSLEAALKTSREGAGPAEASLTQQLQARRVELQQRELLLAELRRGLLPEGQGHSARLRLVAKTIPAAVWVTDVIADDSKMEVRGFTLEPAALNDWMARIAVDPALKGQALSAIKVERVAAEAMPAAPASVASAPKQATWAFTLVSTVVLPASPANGVRK